MEVRMRRKARGWCFLVSLFAGLLWAAGVQAAGEYVLEFRGRTIDLEPFLLGYPYGGVQSELRYGQLLYFETLPEGRWLRLLEVRPGQRVDLSQGRRVGDIDWSTRSWWGSRYHEPSGRLFVESDERNDEHMNVYALDLQSGRLERITSNDYTYAWELSPDGRYLAYVARSGLKEPFDSCLRIRDLETGRDREILCDRGGADRFTWSRILWTPDQTSVILGIQHDGDRKKVSLARIPLENPTMDFLIPPRVVRHGLSILRDWLAPGEFLYTSAETGFDNLYLYDLARRRARRITDFQEEMVSPFVLGTTPPAVAVVLRRPEGSRLLVLHARTGAVLAERELPGTARIVDAYGRDGILSMSSLTTPLELRWFRVKSGPAGWSLELTPLAGVPPEVAAQIVRCEAEKVSYPTFDRLPDGSRRMLHAFYLEPKDPPEDPRMRLVRITAFYGGRNVYDVSSHIMGAAGIATFSPSPRGSWGFGAEFAALNDGDLGGDEIVDIIYAARWLVQEKGYEPWQIGVYGSSHGGYATMRCLTFPPETNGRGEHFDFGFGISHAGFSDILTFYESCNIPDWVLLEAGDPVREREKLADRSPINHVDLLEAPLLVTHGTNDWRVPVSESRRFVAKARQLGKPVTYFEFRGQGHGIRGLENTFRYYRIVFAFLETLGPHGGQ
jgi:dipeptidyl aminopeptidase/acylaminoacyl peptidase